MGMFDSFYDQAGDEWQSKAFGRSLDRFRIGETVPAVRATYQVEICGGPNDGHADSFATIRDGVVEAIGVDRDPALQLLDYYGGLVTEGAQS